MKKISITHIVFAVVAVLLFSTCKRDFINDFKGPAICVPDGFAINNYNVTPEIDFSKKDSVVKINADFSHEVNWDLKIVGRTSKAVKRYSGKSNKINIRWLGNPDSLLFFKNEVCDVVLAINCVKIENKYFTINKATDFSNIGFLLTDFDGNGLYNKKNLGFLTGEWQKYGENGDGSDIIATIDVLPINTPSYQGGNYFYQKATNGEGGYYACGSQTSQKDIAKPIPPTNTTNPCFQNNFPGITSPDSIYVNFFLNVNGNNQSSVVPYFKIGATIYNLTINPDWTGWKYLTYKLSDFKASSTGKPATNITLISFWGFDLQSKDKGPQTVEFAVDFILFTKGKPLFPSLAQ